MGSNPAGGHGCLLCYVLSGRGLCDRLITRPEEFYFKLQAPRPSFQNLKTAHEGGKVVSPAHRPLLPSTKNSCYSSVAESTPEPDCGRKDINEKFQLHHGESNPRPSCLWRCASTNCATAWPLLTLSVPN